MRPLDGHTERRRRSPRRLLWIGVALLLLLLALALFRVGPVPELTLDADLPGIGPQTQLEVRAREPQRGLSDLRVEMQQGDAVFPLTERQFEPRPFWAFWGEKVEEEELRLEIGWESVEGLEEGPAVVRAIAGRAPTWLRRPQPAVEELELEVKRRPPGVQLLSSRADLQQGGSGLIVYRIDGGAEQHGVQVGDHWFPGCPLPGSDDRYFALFGAPYDLEAASEIRLRVADALGNASSLPAVGYYRQRPTEPAQIQLSDGFFDKVLPEILANSPEVRDQGDPLATYLAVNRDLRQRNATELAALAAESRPERLWNGAFSQLPRSALMAPFADRRTYVYEGRPVDQQTHLGVDLASSRQAPVPASNRGVVVLARYLGIYGNTVVLDHGCGLMSLYAHLSSISVEVGQEVVSGATLGLTGETGLAGGDHLHYSVLVHGLMVNPFEWWDGRWVESHVESRLSGP